jgi:hypothetical protein
MPKPTNAAAGVVFAIKSAADKNEIIAYQRSTDGSLQDESQSPNRWQGQRRDYRSLAVPVSTG